MTRVCFQLKCSVSAKFFRPNVCGGLIVSNAQGQRVMRILGDLGVGKFVPIQGCICDFIVLAYRTGGDE